MALFGGKQHSDGLDAGASGDATARGPESGQGPQRAEPEQKTLVTAMERRPEGGSGERGLFRSSKQKNEEGEDVANIGKSISINGDLTGNEDLVIEGKVEGKVDLPNNQLTIGANGTVRAEVKAKAVSVVGRVTGNVSATERIEIQATGIVEGDVSAPRLVVAEGAVVNGSVQMGKSSKPAEAVAPAPPEPARISTA